MASDGPEGIGVDGDGDAVAEPDLRAGDLIDLLSQDRAFGEEGFGITEHYTGLLGTGR